MIRCCLLNGIHINRVYCCCLVAFNINDEVHVCEKQGGGSTVGWEVRGEEIIISFKLVGPKMAMRSAKTFTFLQLSAKAGTGITEHLLMLTLSYDENSHIATCQNEAHLVRVFLK